MKLTLTDANGTIVDQWDIANEFGDLSKSLPRTLMMTEILTAIEQEKNRQIVARNDPYLYPPGTK